ncbi:MAG: T9SS type A sorting domain-containing protein [Candidatus Marinimicrobia bacterium]|nr:T9SS type A sorting domain-containing protein [Candidatus Neomarinimicrobiota bacterium]
MKNCKTLQEALLHLMIASLLAIPILVIAQDVQPKKIIYETDMCADVDDAGGLAILHALANNGEAEILAVCFNEVHPFGAPAIDAMNTWYGRGDIPIGIYKGQLDNPHGSGYLEYVAGFPHDLETADAPSALDVYRQVLAEQPDSSVTIVSVGFLNNINDLLIAEPDLVARKVVELVQMAGVYNDGFNLVQHNLVSVSENVIRNWPTPMVISQEGGSIYTGDNYQNAPEENPVREAFYRYFGGEYRGRPSWDEMAVLYGVRGLTTCFNEQTSGTGQLSNGYTWNMEPEFRSYLTDRYSNSTYKQIIEKLMNQLPLGAHFTVSARSGWLPFTIELDASATNVGGNRTVENYLWDFGDGSSGEGMTVTHDYTSAGNFDIQLTIVDNLGDSLQAIERIRVSDPVFSPDSYFGNVENYIFSQGDLWSTRMDEDNLRLHLSNDTRSSDISLPGYTILKDSLYSDFTLNITTRIDEDLSLSSLAEYTIIFGYEDENNYNYMLMKQTTSRLVNVTNRQSIDIGRTTQIGIPDEQYHKVVINLSDDQLTVTLDDSLFFTAISSRLKKTGEIGFGSSRYAVFFDDVVVAGDAIPASINRTRNMPEHFKLWQNYPNPFNPSTTIQFTLPRSEYVKIEIYNSLGQRLKTLISQQMPEGSHTVVFSGEDMVSGLYFYKIQAGDFQDIKKMILLK